MADQEQTDEERLQELITDREVLRKYSNGNLYMLEQLQRLDREITQLQQKTRLFAVDWETVERCRRYTDGETKALIAAIDNLAAAEEARFNEKQVLNDKLRVVVQALHPLCNREEWPEIPIGADLLQVGIPALFVRLRRYERTIPNLDGSKGAARE